MELTYESGWGEKNSTLANIREFLIVVNVIEKSK